LTIKGKLVSFPDFKGRASTKDLADYIQMGLLIFAIPREVTAQSLIRQQIQEDYDQLYKEKSPDFGENRCFFTERPETCYITYEKVWWVDINQLILQSLS